MLTSAIAQTDSTLTYYCPSLVRVGEVFTVWADYEETTGTDILGANVTAFNSTHSYDLNYSAANSRYEDDFSSSFEMVWDFTINASAVGYYEQLADCSVRVSTPFNLTVRLWEEVELSGFRINNNTSSEQIVTYKNYNKLLEDPYINDFSYIVAVNNDFNATGAYEYCNFPFKVGQNIWNSFSMPNYIGNDPDEDAFADLKNWGGQYIGCDQYWFRAQYDQGEGILELPYHGNYTLYLIEGVIEWENNVSPPRIVKSNLFIPLGNIEIPDSTDYTIDYWISHWGLDFWGTLSDEIFVFLITIMPILIFLFLWFVGVNIKMAGMIAIGWEIIIAVLKAAL
jgi:hypothetical protein